MTPTQLNTLNELFERALKNKELHFSFDRTKYSGFEQIEYLVCFQDDNLPESLNPLYSHCKTTKVVTRRYINLASAFTYCKKVLDVIEENK